MEPFKRTSVQKSNKNEIFMARAIKTNFSLSPSRIDESGHNTASKKNIYHR